MYGQKHFDNNGKAIFVSVPAKPKQTGLGGS
jgi:hypothetical protein